MRIRQVITDLSYFKSFSFLMLLFLHIDFVHGQNISLTNIYEAWKITSNSNEMVIAIIDNGVNNNIPFISENLWKNKHEISENYIDDDNNGFIDDDFGWNFKTNTNDITNSGLGNWHGTPINGIINYIVNNPVSQNISNVKLLNIIKGDSIESIIQSLNYIYNMKKIYNNTGGVKGANIVAINCSWGKDFLWAFDYPDWCKIYDRLGSEGVLCVSSVPNCNIDIDFFGDMPSTCASEFLITVTNSNSYDEKVYEAGYGATTVDLSAPGENTYTMLNTGAYGYFSGTSAAAPYVTGVIGLLYSLPSEIMQQDLKKNPEKVASIVKSVILQGIDMIPELENITVSGGRLNAFNSVKLLCDYYGEQHLYENLFEPLEILSIYPNPANININTTITVESNTSTYITISITDINGRILKSITNVIYEGIIAIPINLSGIASGFYIVTASTNKTTRSIKLVIQ